MHIDELKQQCDQFLTNRQKLVAGTVETMPVFVDWNIGNFSVTDHVELYSRWDYDWFRISYRVMDFYFFSRVVSDLGDRTVFSYGIGPLMEDRFMLFLKEYHRVYPLTENEIRFLPEAFRFFILNYVVKYGRFFFHRTYAIKLQREAYEIYFRPSNSSTRRRCCGR
jgi:Ser/Thr protein kinase RdoA (MazF antagonist)